MVAGVFVRVYNEQPTFSVSDAPAFCKGLVSYLHVQTQSQQFRAAQADIQETLSEGLQFLQSISMYTAAFLELPANCQASRLSRLSA